MNRHAPYASMTWIRFLRVGLSPLSRKAPLVTKNQFSLRLSWLSRRFLTLSRVRLRTAEERPLCHSEERSDEESHEAKPPRQALFPFAPAPRSPRCCAPRDDKRVVVTSTLSLSTPTPALPLDRGRVWEGVSLRAGIAHAKNLTPLVPFPRLALTLREACPERSRRAQGDTISTLCHSEERSDEESHEAKPPR